MRRLWALIVVLAVVTGCGKHVEPVARSGPPLAPTTTMGVVHWPTTAPPARQHVKRRGDVWAVIASCETGGKMDNPHTGNGYWGFFQFDLDSWRRAGGGPGVPSDYSYDEQRRVAIRWQQMRGWSAWPRCRHNAGV